MVYLRTKGENSEVSAYVAWWVYPPLQRDRVTRYAYAHQVLVLIIIMGHRINYRNDVKNNKRGGVCQMKSAVQCNKMRDMRRGG